METAEDVLEHFGVKGMKWGVRKVRDWRFKRKGEKGFILPLRIAMKADKVYNARDLNRINNKAEYKNQDFNRPSALRDKYLREHNLAYAKRLQEAADSFGTNASGTKKYAISMDNDGNWDIGLEDVKHADESPTMKAIVTYDENGYIVSVSVQEDQMEQSDEVDEFLEHFGIKGMKWGVRKKEHLPTSEDSEKSTAARRKTKQGGVKVLSNKELQDVITRMNLERQYSSLNPSKLRRGIDFVKDILSIGQTVSSVVSLTNAITKQVKKTK